MKFNIHTVLIAPLDWGLGHATRCIPIINSLIKNGFNVIIAASGAQRTLLSGEFRNLEFIELPGYNIRYSRKKWALPLKIIVQVPFILRTIRNEHAWLEKTIDTYKIDLVISDNRYGLYTTKIPCVFITHQLRIQSPFKWLEQLIQAINYKYINRFAACWVPDIESNINIGGGLSHPEKKPITPVLYMGLLSRFEMAVQEEIKYDYCIVLSGPEPQRTLLENRIIEQVKNETYRILLVRGKPGSNKNISVSPNVEVKNHLSGNEMRRAFMQSRYIISRCGYTTVMELLSLQKKSILIPTPGQTEQEYLAKKLMKEQLCFCVRQNRFYWQACTIAAKQFSYRAVSLPVFDDKKLIQLMQPLHK